MKDAVSLPRAELLPMTEQDLEDVLRIEYRVYPYPWSRANFTDSMVSGYSGWVCRVDGELVGYFVLMMAVDEAHLLNISVAERLQGKGGGALLLEKAMSVAKSDGGRTVLLEVRPSYEKALALYRRYAFRQIGVRRGYYPKAGGREDALVLARDLMEEVCA